MMEKEGRQSFAHAAATMASALPESLRHEHTFYGMV
jgi:hypothetical protein